MTSLTSKQIKTIKINNSSKLNLEKSLKKIEYITKTYLKNEYGPNCNIKYTYSYQVIENLINHKCTHLYSIFKDNMINEYIDEFLKRFYRKRESHKKIPQFALFYTNYQKYFCTPTFPAKFYNKKIHRQREEKAKCFYNAKFKDKDKDKESNSCSDNDIEMCPASTGGKPGIGKKYYKNNNEKNNKTFFNEEIKELLENESLSVYCDINSKNTISLHESGSKLKSNRSYLLNNSSNEESLCNIMNGLYNKKIFNYNSRSDTKKSNKTLLKKNKNEKDINNINNENNKNNSSKNILNKKINIDNNLKLVLKKRVINIKNKHKNKNISTSNNYETFEFKNKKGQNLSANLYKTIGIQNLKIVVNDKEFEKTTKNKRSAKKLGLWNIINDKDNVNTHVKSQDNNANKRANKLITFYKNKKVSRNISYFFLHKKKSLPTSKSNISAKSKKNEFDKLQIQNIFKNHKINDFAKNSNYSKDKIRNIKKKSYKPLRISKSNININPNESLLNKIKKRVLEKKAHSRETLRLKNKIDGNNLNYNTFKRTPNSLSIFYPNLNTNEYRNHIKKNYQRNNNKIGLKSNQNIFKSNKLIKSPSISEFMRYIRVQRNASNSVKKKSQRNYQTIEGKANNIQNLNININNQINIRLNNINEIPSESLNNKKFQIKQKLISKNKNRSINFNTNQNLIIKYNNNIPTFISQNNYKPKNYRIFGNKHS